MCRVFGLVCAEPTSCEHELLHAENPIIRQSEQHDSGWGMAVYERTEGCEPRVVWLGTFELHWRARPGALMVASERVTEEPWHTVAQDVLLALHPRDREEPHAERLLGDELVARAHIDALEEQKHLRGAERGAFAAERAARALARG